MWRSAVQVCLGLLSTFTPDHYLGGLAQLARAPALQAGGQRFESVILHTERQEAEVKAKVLLIIFTFYYLITFLLLYLSKVL